jgi:hypothetical protein
MAPRRLAELGKGERRRAWLRTVLTVALAWAVLVGTYYLVSFRQYSDTGAIVRLGTGVSCSA